MTSHFTIFIESGTKRTFAGAVDWPGWCRSGKDEAAAIQALFDYAPRYAKVIQAAAGLEFHHPDSPQAFVVSERFKGNSSTDFGAPDAIPAGDRAEVDETWRAHSEAILYACWQALDRAALAAAGKQLRKGPRGGGREVDEIIRHNIEADTAYLGRIGCKLPPGPDQAISRQAIIDSLETAIRGGLPTHGPRGGAMWPARYFVRRVAWHILDHTWEIEDRIIENS